MRNDLENLARRQPALILGGALVLGLIGARFIKSSERGRERRWSGREGRFNYDRSGMNEFETGRTGGYVGGGGYAGGGGYSGIEGGYTGVEGGLGGGYAGA